MDYNEYVQNLNLKASNESFNLLKKIVNFQVLQTDELYHLYDNMIRPIIFALCI